MIYTAQKIDDTDYPRWNDDGLIRASLIMSHKQMLYANGNIYYQQQNLEGQER